MLQTLKKYFGYTEFRPLQEDIIKTIFNKQDACVIMPTGSGKSLTYQLPSVMMPGITIVVSPLIALMKDQVDSLKANGIKAAYINSSLSYQEIDEVKELLTKNEIDILYVAPERLMMSHFLPFVESLSIDLFAIDEAHCISEWGHDFRPEYRQLNILKSKFPAIPVLTLTATATPVVQQDIIKQLKLPAPQLFKSSFNRENLFYRILPKQDTYQQLYNYLEAHRKDSGIIYCQSRKTVDKLAFSLNEDGFKALPYHAGLDKVIRTKHQEMFINDDANIIVATIAFGMGIDKPNVRFVIHYDLPKNIEGYYQETGRAGRDGLPSDCLLFYSYGDRTKIEYFIFEKESEAEQVIALEKLDQMINYCTSALCRRKVLLEYFGETFQQQKCDKCDNCIDSKDVFDATIEAQKLLSCVKRVGERFGLTYVIDVLRGSNSERIIHNRHNHLSTYGIGKDRSKKQWQSIARELIQLDYLKSERAFGNYPILMLTEKSHDVLFNDEKVMLTRFEEKHIMTTKIDTNFDEILFEQLRQLRKRIADEENLPPYIVFQDTTLKEMATFYPVTWETLRRITGVGEEKLKRYGPRFLKIIVGHCQKYKIDPRPIVRNSSSGSYSRKMRSYTDQETLSLLKQGLTIEQIAKKRNLAASTITSHIEKLIFQGEEIVIERFVPPEKQRAIRRAFKEVGVDRLAPVKDRLGNGYSYDELRLVRAKMLAGS